MTDPVGECSLDRPVSWSGTGLHTGRPATITVDPAEAGHGIVFAHAGHDARLPVHWKAALPMPGCSGLVAPDGRRFMTVEHLLASLMAAGIDNALVTVDGPELPILDGSARPFMAALVAAGRIRQDRPRIHLQVAKPVEIRDGDRFIRLDPADEFFVDLSLTLRGLPDQRWAGSITSETFTNEIAPARSFTSAGRAMTGKFIGRVTGKPILKGAGPDNLMIVSHGRIRAQDGPRFADECARHRVLDVIGDLALAGRPILGRITAFRTAHKYNQALLRQWLSDPEAWHEVTRERE